MACGYQHFETIVQVEVTVGQGRVRGSTVGGRHSDVKCTGGLAKKLAVILEKGKAS